jgi:hypothetical protein
MAVRLPIPSTDPGRARWSALRARSCAALDANPTRHSRWIDREAGIVGGTAEQGHERKTLPGGDRSPAMSGAWDSMRS